MGWLVKRKFSRFTVAQSVFLQHVGTDQLEKSGGRLGAILFFGVKLAGWAATLQRFDLNYTQMSPPCVVVAKHPPVEFCELTVLESIC
jgi:hypothetical protein